MIVFIIMNMKKIFYNVRMASTFESAVDYVNMHYSYCERKGKFWDYVRLSQKNQVSKVYGRSNK